MDLMDVFTPETLRVRLREITGQWMWQEMSHDDLVTLKQEEQVVVDMLRWITAMEWMTGQLR